MPTRPLPAQNRPQRRKYPPRTDPLRRHPATSTQLGENESKLIVVLNQMNRIVPPATLLLRPTGHQLPFPRPAPPFSNLMLPAPAGSRVGAILRVRRPRVPRLRPRLPSFVHAAVEKYKILPLRHDFP